MTTPFVKLVVTYMNRFTCSVCGYIWEYETSTDPMACDSDPQDGDLIDCGNCKQGVQVKYARY